MVISKMWFSTTRVDLVVYKYDVNRMEYCAHLVATSSWVATVKVRQILH